MQLIDKVFNRRIILWLLVSLLFIIIAFWGVRILQDYQTDKEFSGKRQEFFIAIESYAHSSAMEIWPEVYTYYKDNDVFLAEFSDKLFEIYSNYYVDAYEQDSKSTGAYMICRDFHSFLEPDAFEMVVSAVFEDFLYDRIDYRTFIAAINDFYLFSQYKSPKVVELLDHAAGIYNSRQSYLLGESNLRTGNFDVALEYYRNVIPQDILFYPKALEKIDECIILLKEQLVNEN